MIEIQRILVPTDFSKFSESAVRYACEFAHRFNAELHVLHVVWNSAPPRRRNGAEPSRSTTTTFARPQRAILRN